MYFATGAKPPTNFERRFSAGHPKKFTGIHDGVGLGRIARSASSVAHVGPRHANGPAKKAANVDTTKSTTESGSTVKEANTAPSSAIVAGGDPMAALLPLLKVC